MISTIPRNELQTTHANALPPLPEITSWFYITGYCIMIKANSSLDAAMYFMRRFHPDEQDYWIQPRNIMDAVIRMQDEIAYEVSYTSGYEWLTLAPGQVFYTPTPINAEVGTVVACQAPRPLSERVFDRALEFLSLVGVVPPLTVSDQWELREIQVSRDVLTDLQVQRLDTVLNNIDVASWALTREELDIVSALVRIVPPFDFEGPAPQRPRLEALTDDFATGYDEGLNDVFQNDLTELELEALNNPGLEDLNDDLNGLNDGFTEEELAELVAAVEEAEAEAYASF